MTDLVHFYHVYAAGEWREPVTEHLELLDTSGLAVELHSIHVGLVGNPHQCAEAAMFIQNFGLPTTLRLAATEPEGYEHITLVPLAHHASLNDATYLYTHTKGAWAALNGADTDLNTAWRRSMEHDTVTRWKECLHHLDEGFDAVGSHRIHPPHGGGYYGGNYWWATSSHLRSLPPIDHATRWHAETWISTNPHARLYDMRPGWPGHTIFHTEQP